jgi:hypothetical protein
MVTMPRFLCYLATFRKNMRYVGFQHNAASYRLAYVVLQCPRLCLRLSVTAILPYQYCYGIRTFYNEYRARLPIYRNDQRLVPCSNGGDIACCYRVSALAPGTIEFSHPPTVRQPSRRR